MALDIRLHRAHVEVEVRLYRGDGVPFCYKITFRGDQEENITQGFSKSNEMLWSLCGDIHRGGSAGRRPANLAIINRGLNRKDFEKAVKLLKQKLKLAQREPADI